MNNNLRRLNNVYVVFEITKLLKKVHLKNS